MGQEWAEVDVLMREIGSLRQASVALHVSKAAEAAIDLAIREAAEAVNRTIDSPRSREKLKAAREAVAVAADVLAGLDAEIGRSRRARARGEALRTRAQELIAQARMARIE